ncbi:small, acid-soluble spore protein, alpha/beta type [Peribacillus sp. NPDC097264]|uniref:small, acid-soluble spore protein, alpha/beta type n=1 Tax=unclassified Peribacillus TaxID=2675266 RepID=UPI003805F3D5
MSRRNKILVEEARADLNQLKAKVAGSRTHEEAKFEAANEVGIPLKKGYNGQMTAKQAGKIGGHLGGNMVKSLVEMAKENLKVQK